MTTLYGPGPERKERSRAPVGLCRSHSLSFLRLAPERTETEAFDDDWDGYGRAQYGEIDDELWVGEDGDAYYDEIDEEDDA